MKLLLEQNDTQCPTQAVSLGKVNESIRISNF